MKNIYIVEAKGVMLAGNPDTEYKESVFDLCNRYSRKGSSDKINLVLKEIEIEYEVIYGSE